MKQQVAKVQLVAELTPETPADGSVTDQTDFYVDLLVHWNEAEEGKPDRASLPIRVQTRGSSGGAAAAIMVLLAVVGWAGYMLLRRAM